MDGICTLANDRVYDQLIALLNSIEAIMGTNFPVCVYPYDNQTDQIQAEIKTRPQVQLYNDQASITRWEKFIKQIWDLHPRAKSEWLAKQIKDPYHRIGTHYRFCAFDNPFDRFLYMDADTLLIDSVDRLFDQLNQYDFVVYDFQYKDPSHVYQIDHPQLKEIFSTEQINQEIFCSGLFASKRGIFPDPQLEVLLEHLRSGDIDILYPFAPDQTILNYIIMRSNLKIGNLAHILSTNQRTGCCVTSPHFQTINNILYDKGIRLTYLHYIGLSSQLFTKLCQGENIDFPYRDLFLHYRYLHQPDQKPKFTTKPIPYNAPPSIVTKILRKLGLK